MMFYIALAAFAGALLPLAKAGNSCVAMDSEWNLLVFNVDGKDYNIGNKDEWSWRDPTQLSNSGRPPFSGWDVTCYLSQYSNAIYVLGADASNPKNIHIYNAWENAWSTQSVDGPEGFDPNALFTILDHDTNVFYGLSNGEMYNLAMGDELSTAEPETKWWEDVSEPNFSTDGYTPVMALAKNHVHFINAPDTPAGSARIFVIHYAYFQPEIQWYGNFPNSHGRTASFFVEDREQYEFAFVPDSGDNTYVINVESNSTRTYPGPFTKDSDSVYFGSPNTLVQLTSDGAVNYLPYSDGENAQWSSVEVWAKLAPPAPSSSPASTEAPATTETSVVTSSSLTTVVSSVKATSSSKMSSSKTASATASVSHAASGSINGAISGHAGGAGITAVGTLAFAFFVGAVFF